MMQSQEEFGIHLSQALSYLHSCSHRMRTWAALFLGARAPARGDPQALPQHWSHHCTWTPGPTSKQKGVGALGGQEWV